MSVQVRDLLEARATYLAALDEVECELRDRDLESIAEPAEDLCAFVRSVSASSVAGEKGPGWSVANSAC
jgi:hypothetical protein